MAPTWLPVCAAMQKYCEPYFAAVERWRNYSDTKLTHNRIHLVEVANQILSDYSQCEDTYEFDIVCEQNEFDLHDEVLPSPGKEYVPSGDTKAFDAAKRFVPGRIFNRIGLFFQTNLLKAVAGYSDNYLSKSNHDNRKSIIAAIEKLFRLPEQAGHGHFVYRLLHTTDEVASKMKSFPQQVMGDNTKGFVDVLVSSKEAIPAVANADAHATTFADDHAQSKSDKSSSGKSKKSSAWTDKHSSVGTSVAAYFQQGKGKKLFQGKIVKYCPPSKPGAKDHLYHVQWEDGDEEDYDETDLKKGMALFEKSFGTSTAAPATATAAPSSASTTSPVVASKPTPTKPKEVEVKVPKWTNRDASVGKKVAAAFMVKGDKKVMQGTVVQYRPPSTNKAKDAAYKIEFEDGETAEYSAEQFGKGVSMYEKHFAALEEEEAEEEAEFQESDDWTTYHSSVGTDVAAYFPGPNRKRRLFKGKVTKYAPETAPGESDQLYHILWEDNDEADYDEKELAEGVRLYNENFGNNEIVIVDGDHSDNANKRVKRNPLINEQEGSAAGTVDLTGNSMDVVESESHAVNDPSSGTTSNDNDAKDVEDAEYEVVIETKSHDRVDTEEATPSAAADILELVNDIAFPSEVTMLAEAQEEAVSTTVVAAESESIAVPSVDQDQSEQDQMQVSSL